MGLLPLETDLRTGARLARNVLRQRRGTNAPLFASYFVTDRCNVRCDGCVYYDNLEPGQQGRELDTADAIRIVRALAEGGVALVLYAGGEPMMRKDLPEILAAGRAAHLTQGVFMNGMLVSERALAAVDSSCSWLLFSPHVPTELGGRHADEQYERSWQGFAEACRRLQRARAVCTLNVNRHTVPLMEDILERARAAGAHGVKFQPNWFPAMFPDAEQVEQALAVMRTWKRRHPRFVLGSSSYIEKFPSYFGPQPRVSCTVNRRFHLGVQADGTVSACCPELIPIGNLLERPLSEMLSARLETRDRCYGCHRLDVDVGLKLAGGRA